MRTLIHQKFRRAVSMAFLEFLLKEFSASKQTTCVEHKRNKKKNKKEVREYLAVIAPPIMYVGTKI